MLLESVMFSRRYYTNILAYFFVTRCMYIVAQQNVDKITQYAAKLLLLPASENEGPPYWDSTSSFDFELFFVIGISFCISPPNFIQIGQRTTEIAEGSHVRFCVSITKSPSKCNCRSQLDLQIWSWSYVQFRRYFQFFIVRRWRFALKLPIHMSWLFLLNMRRISGTFTSVVENVHILDSFGIDMSISLTVTIYLPIVEIYLSLRGGIPNVLACCHHKVLSKRPAASILPLFTFFANFWEFYISCYSL